MPILSWLFSEPLPLGSIAPEFTLPDQNGNTVTLSHLRGQNVVLVFYPRDETPVCRTQLCEFRDRSELAASRNAVVLGINPQSGASHADFSKRQRLNFPLLVDKGGAVCEAYRTKGLVTKRTVYLIDTEGVIRYAQRGKPTPEQVLAAAS